jgi:hypothetical protein
MEDEREEENNNHVSLFTLWQTTWATEGLNHNIAAARKIWCKIQNNSQKQRKVIKMVT